MASDSSETTAAVCAASELSSSGRTSCNSTHIRFSALGALAHPCSCRHADMLDPCAWVHDQETHIKPKIPAAQHSVVSACAGATPYTAD